MVQWTRNLSSSWCFHPWVIDRVSPRPLPHRRATPGTCEGLFVRQHHATQDRPWFLIQLHHDRTGHAHIQSSCERPFVVELWTTNVIERLHEEFRRRVKTQGSLPNDNAAVVLLF